MSEADISKGQGMPLNEGETDNLPRNEEKMAMAEPGSAASMSTIIPEEAAAENCGDSQPKADLDIEPNELAARGHSLSSSDLAKSDLLDDQSPASSEEDLVAEDLVAADPALLIQQLQQDNCHLLSRVTLLEKVLEECQNALQAQLARLETQDLLIGRQAEELQQSQEKSAEILQELEASQQTARRQQILVETLTHQLEESQSRVTQLEQENANVQQQCREQSRQLSRTESSCRELRSRLYRQQRQTLQFKAALEKCLEVAVPANDTSNSYPQQGDNAAPASGQSTPVKPEVTPDLATFAPKAQPIQPWSVSLGNWDVASTVNPDPSAPAPSVSQPVPPISATSGWATTAPQAGKDEVDNEQENAATNETVQDSASAPIDEDRLKQTLPSAFEEQSNSQFANEMAEYEENLLTPEAAESLNDTLQLVAERLLSNLLDPNAADDSASPESGLSDTLGEASYPADLYIESIDVTPEPAAASPVSDDRAAETDPIASLLVEEEEHPASRNWFERPAPVNDFADCLRGADPMGTMDETIHSFPAETEVPTAMEPAQEQPLDLASDTTDRLSSFHLERTEVDAEAQSGNSSEQEVEGDFDTVHPPSYTDVDLTLDWELDAATRQDWQSETSLTGTVSAAADQTIEVEPIDPVSSQMSAGEKHLAELVRLSESAAIAASTSGRANNSPEAFPIADQENVIQSVEMALGKNARDGDFDGATSPEIWDEDREPEVWTDAETQPSPQELIAANKHSPSPLIHPLRPSKKRKSLASVDLPSFLR